MTKENIIIIEKKGICNKGIDHIYAKENTEHSAIDYIMYATMKVYLLFEKLTSTYDLEKSDMILGFFFNNNICSKIEYSLTFVPFHSPSFTKLGNVNNVMEFASVIIDVDSKNNYLKNFKEYKYEYILINKNEIIIILNLIVNYYKYLALDKKVYNNNLTIDCYTDQGVTSFFEKGFINNGIGYIVDIKNAFSNITIDSVFDFMHIAETKSILNLASAIDIYTNQVNLYFKCVYDNNYYKEFYYRKLDCFFDDLLIYNNTFYLKIRR